MTLPLPLVSVRGSYSDMGREYGRLCRQLIERNVVDYIERFDREVGTPVEEVRRLGSGFRNAVREYSPDIHEMLEGVALGSGQDADLIFALNGRTEILYGHGSREDACTSIAVTPSATADGHTLIGQNWDWHPDQKPLSLLLRTEDEDGLTVLTLTEAGMLAKSGLNSAGIAVCANLLASDRDHAGVGIPYHCILRGVLQSRSMADALRMAADNDRVSSGNVLIADGDGGVIDLELAPGDFGHLLPTDGVVVHANHFASDVDVKDLRKAKSALTLLRPTRARQVLADATGGGPIDIDSLTVVFRDHYSYPNGICRHVDPREDEDRQVASLFCMVMDVSARTMHLAEAPICESAFIELALAETHDEVRSRGA